MQTLASPHSSDAEQSDISNTPRAPRKRARRTEEPELDHPRLNELRRQSRIDAENSHAYVSETRRKKAIISRVKTARQASNKKSAEICRMSKQLYIEKLEDEIIVEEEEYRGVMNRLLIQAEQNLRMEHRIREFEECREMEARGKSWLCQDNSNVAKRHLALDGLFVDGGELTEVAGDVHVLEKASWCSDDCLDVDEFGERESLFGTHVEETVFLSPPKKRRVSKHSCVSEAGTTVCAEMMESYGKKNDAIFERVMSPVSVMAPPHVVDLAAVHL